MTRSFRNRLLFAAMGLLLLSLSAACGGGAKPEQSAPDKAEAVPPARNPMEVSVSAELTSKLKVGSPTWSEVAGALRVPARVEADETREARVSSPVTGRIIELNVVEGQTVKRGDVIAVIRSTELSNVQSDFLKAQSARRLAERAVERSHRLLEAGVIAEAERQRREAELSQATAELASLRDTLRVLGMSEEAVHQLETTRTVTSITQASASIDGIILERKVTFGQVVQEAEVLCIIADLSHVWIVADVPEQAAGALATGKAVEAEVPALPGETLRGTLSFVSARVNPETRTVQARIDVPNPQRRYKPAMLATMLLKDGSERQRVVPNTAVVRENGLEHVFVVTGERTFLLRPVKLGDEFQQVRVVTEGLNAGEKIVLDGAFHLNNERKRMALQGS